MLGVSVPDLVNDLVKKCQWQQHFWSDVYIYHKGWILIPYEISWLLYRSPSVIKPNKQNQDSHHGNGHESHGVYLVGFNVGCYSQVNKRRILWNTLCLSVIFILLKIRLLFGRYL